MRSILFSVLSLLSFLQIACASNPYKNQILNVQTKEAMTLGELSDALNVDVLIIGEKHYTPKVQTIESQIIKLFKEVKLNDELVFGWEFLAYTEQEKNQILWSEVLNGNKAISDFLKETQGDFGDSYKPVLEAVINANMGLVGLNLTRKEKAPVVKSGIKAIDPKLLPEDYEKLGENYFERFKQAMAGHATPEQLVNFYDAQCLTDDVMADQINKTFKNGTVVIMGSFHSDYFDGTVARLKARNPDLKVAVIRIVDQSDYTLEEIPALIWHPKYGIIANYVWFLNNPKKE